MTWPTTAIFFIVMTSASNRKGAGRLDGISVALTHLQLQLGGLQPIFCRTVSWCCRIDHMYKWACRTKELFSLACESEVILDKLMFHPRWGTIIRSDNPTEEGWQIALVLLPEAWLPSVSDQNGVCPFVLMTVACFLGKVRANFRFGGRFEQIFSVSRSGKMSWHSSPAWKGGTNNSSEASCT
ncbi:unnamed protein product [Protopolystoma xenopodis]|uniref:Uncharacterized protein n=1 Tax=Protopolystoma xenopodis TaxID=117903 RepID=A0A448WBF7_9PLAT|nr:unnamed protein product [Protopolystoma xenopodis]